MATLNAWYPPGSSTASSITANQGTPGSLANAWPVKITDGTDLALVNASGELQVTASALPLPSGAATAARQDTGNTSLASIDTKLTAPLSVTGPLTDAQLRATAVPVSAAFLPLPSGAATEATLSTLNGKVTACNTGAVVVSSSALPSGASTEATLSSLNGKVTACNTGAVVISSSALPSGAATEATLSTLNGKVTACNTGAVVVSSGTITAKAGTPTAGTVTQAAVTVGTSAVRCTVSGSAPSSSRSLLIVQPDPSSSASFYIGSSSVASSGGSRGVSVAPGEKIYFNNDAGDYYIISGTAAQTVFITEQA